MTDSSSLSDIYSPQESNRPIEGSQALEATAASWQEMCWASSICQTRIRGFGGNAWAGQRRVVRIARTECSVGRDDSGQSDFKHCH